MLHTEYVPTTWMQQFADYLSPGFWTATAFSPTDISAVKPWAKLMMITEAAFQLAGEGLCIGRDSGSPVTDDYPGTPPHRFTGGVIKRVAVDVSGEPYVDLEREAAAMLARSNPSALRQAASVLYGRVCERLRALLLYVLRYGLDSSGSR
jgi:hypothetical protein